MSLVFDGLADLKVALLAMPKELQVEAGHIVQAHANAAAARIKDAYGQHWVTGYLTKGVTVTYDLTTGVAASAVLKSTAPHAYLFENGSEARHYTTVNGKLHQTGRMTGFHVVIPRVMQERRNMYADIKDLLVRKGLIVSGDA
jgi:hypothetical protein